MGRVDYQQYFVFLAVLTANVWPLGAYLARAFTYDRTFLDPLVVPIERLIVRLIGPEADRSMKWQEYFLAFISFGFAGAVLIFVLLKLQHLPPFYQVVGGRFLSTPMTNDLAINTAVSFATTTTWQAYAGEATMSYCSQIVALGAQNFLAAAAGRPILATRSAFRS
jgi:K+-transporting ATPase ATPase A chain